MQLVMKSSVLLHPSRIWADAAVMLYGSNVVLRLLHSVTHQFLLLINLPFFNCTSADDYVASGVALHPSQYYHSLEFAPNVKVKNVVLKVKSNETLFMTLLYVSPEAGLRVAIYAIFERRLIQCLSLNLPFSSGWLAFK